MKKSKILAVLALFVALIAVFAAPHIDPLQFVSTETVAMVKHLGLVSGGSSMLGMCVSLGSIKSKCGANPGGTTELYVINKVDVLTFPAVGPDGVTLSGPIVPKDGKGFAKWDFLQDTGDFNFKLSGDPGSQSFEHTIGAYIARFNPEIAAIYNGLPNSELIAIKVDGVGQKIVFGDLQRPLVPNLDYKSGKKFNEKNGAEFSLTCGNSHVPYFHSGEIPVLVVVAAPEG